MKAIDYVENHKADYILICDDKTDRKFISNLLNAFAKEMKAMVKSRGCKTDEAAEAVVRELNQKCNKVLDLLEKSYGKRNWAKNCFEKYIEIKVKEIKTDG